MPAMDFLGRHFTMTMINTPVVDFSYCLHLDLFDTVTFTETVVTETVDLPSICCCSNKVLHEFHCSCATNYHRSDNSTSWEIEKSTTTYLNG